MLLSSEPVLSLQPTNGSPFFQTKFIFLQTGARTVLGRQDTPEVSATATGATRPRSASSTNGWFPIPSGHGLESEHTEVWLENGKVRTLACMLINR